MHLAMLTPSSACSADIAIFRLWAGSDDWATQPSSSNDVNPTYLWEREVHVGVAGVGAWG